LHLSNLWQEKQRDPEALQNIQAATNAALEPQNCEDNAAPLPFDISAYVIINLLYAHARWTHICQADFNLNSTKFATILAINLKKTWLGRVSCRITNGNYS